jgi:hypothetical protein
VLSDAIVTVWSSSCPSSRWMSARLSQIWSIEDLSAVKSPSSCAVRTVERPATPFASSSLKSTVIVNGPAASLPPSLGGATRIGFMPTDKATNPRAGAEAIDARRQRVTRRLAANETRRHASSTAAPSAGSSFRVAQPLVDRVLHRRLFFLGVVGRFLVVLVLDRPRPDAQLDADLVAVGVRVVIEDSRDSGRARSPSARPRPAAHLERGDDLLRDRDRDARVALLLLLARRCAVIG